MQKVTGQIVNRPKACGATMTKVMNTLDYLTLPPEGALSVQIPIDSTISSLVNNYRYITDECKEWCKTEIKNNYGLHRVKPTDTFWPVIFGYHLWFTDEKDAILFKMRWL